MLDHVSWRESLLPCRRAWFPVVVRRSKRAARAGEPQSKGCDETRHIGALSSLSKSGCAETAALRPRPYSAFFTSAAAAAATCAARRRRLSASATPSCEASHTVSTPMASAAQTQEGGPLPCALRMPARARRGSRMESLAGWVARLGEAIRGVFLETKRKICSEKSVCELCILICQQYTYVCILPTLQL